VTTERPLVSTGNREFRPVGTSGAIKNDSLVVGDPDLSGDPVMCWPKLSEARDEAQFVGSALSTTPFIDKEASFANIVKQLKAGQKTLSYIHFATHGMSDPIDPADKSFLR
jgi:hypothetical protein